MRMRKDADDVVLKRLMIIKKLIEECNQLFTQIDKDAKDVKIQMYNDMVDEDHVHRYYQKHLLTIERIINRIDVHITHVESMEDIRTIREPRAGKKHVEDPAPQAGAADATVEYTPETPPAEEDTADDTEEDEADDGTDSDRD